MSTIYALVNLVVCGVRARVLQICCSAQRVSSVSKTVTRAGNVLCARVCSTACASQPLIAAKKLLSGRSGCTLAFIDVSVATGELPTGLLEVMAMSEMPDFRVNDRRYVGY